MTECTVDFDLITFFVTLSLEPAYQRRRSRRLKMGGHSQFVELILVLQQA